MMGRFTKGDEVSLLSGGFEVGAGTVLKIEANELVRNIPLDRNQIGVLVEKCYDESCVLPFPSHGLQRLRDAVDSCVIWESSSMFLKCSLLPENLRMGSFPSNSQANIVERCSKFDEVDEVGDLMEGDAVDMFIGGSLVSKGVIFCVNSNGKCHNECLGRGRFSVRISEAVQGNEKLPYPHLGAETVFEAVGTWVLWDVADLFKFSVKDAPDVPSANVFKEFSMKDFTNRSTWMAEEVDLYDDGHLRKVARGIITLPFESGVVDDEVLGPDHVGIVVVNIIDSTLFPTIRPGVPGLVKWSINSLLLISASRFIGDILQDVPNNSVVLGRDDLNPDGEGIDEPIK